MLCLQEKLYCAGSAKSASPSLCANARRSGNNEGRCVRSERPTATQNFIMPAHQPAAPQNQIKMIEVQGQPVTAHDAKTAALTEHFVQTMG